jgi:surface antigen
MIMAWVDGQSDPVESKLVEAYLQQDPAAAERVAMFRRTGRELGQLFDQPLHEPVPQRLLDAVLSAPSVPAASRPRLSTLLSSMLATYTPIFSAAAIAIVMVVGGTIWKNGSRIQHRENVVADADLQRVLDTLPSGTEVAVQSGDAILRMMPLTTFVDTAGNYCREYERIKSTVAIAGVGCRRDDGKWHIEAEAETVPTPKRVGIAPVGRKPVPAIDAAVDRLIKGDVLGSQPEADLIAKQWRREK